MLEILDELFNQPFSRRACKETSERAPYLLNPAMTYMISQICSVENKMR